MASALGNPMSKAGGIPPPGGGSKPDPMVQPALANAMRFGKMFTAMAPAGSRAGAQTPMQGQPGAAPAQPGRPF